MNRRMSLGIALVAIAGVGLRAWAYRSALGDTDSDEAIVGLMARHVLHGELTVFYWGQAYGGTQEVLLSAPVLAVAGTNLLALRVVTLALSVVAAWLVWRIGLRTIGSRGAAVAAGLIWVWPPFEVMWLVHERGFYGSNLVYCCLLLLLALRIAELPSAMRVAVFGLVLGLGFWQTAQVIPIALPTLAWIVWAQRAALRQAWAGAAGALVGASPWIVWNAVNGWQSLMPRASAAQYVDSLRHFASPLLPMLLGLRAPLSSEPLLPKAVTLVVYGALLVLFVYTAIRVRLPNVILLIAVAATFPFIWAISRRVTSETSRPIYLLVLVPVIVLLVARLAVNRVAAVTVLAAATAITAVTFQRMNTWFATDVDQNPPRTPRDLAPLIAELDRLGVDRVYADYWIAYRIAFATDERIVATNDDFDHLAVRHGEITPVPSANVRFRAYQDAVRAPGHGFVLIPGQVESESLLRRLERSDYRRSVVGPFVVFAPPGR